MECLWMGEEYECLDSMKRELCCHCGYIVIYICKYIRLSFLECSENSELTSTLCQTGT